MGGKALRGGVKKNRFGRGGRNRPCSFLTKRCHNVGENSDETSEKAGVGGREQVGRKKDDFLVKGRLNLSGPKKGTNDMRGGKRKDGCWWFGGGEDNLLSLISDRKWGFRR